MEGPALTPLRLGTTYAALCGARAAGSGLICAKVSIISNLLREGSAVEHKALAASEFCRPVEVATLGEGERRIAFAATPEEREMLAKRFGILAVDDLSGEALVQAIGGGGARARVTFTSTVVQASVVTLEPVRDRIDEAFEVDFLPAAESVATGSFEEEDVDPAAAEPPGEVIDGWFDLGGMVAEYLALSMDQYPRAEGEEFGEWRDAGDGAPERKEGPLAALKNWRSRA
jgi:hypothetical protein